jgi:hypothetical protein
LRRFGVKAIRPERDRRVGAALLFDRLRLPARKCRSCVHRTVLSGFVRQRGAKEAGMRDLIDKIVEIEWNLFDKVENVTGRADCQDDRETFDIMRKSQFEAWNEDLLLSYLADLDEALERGRNPVAEKYAYMMEYTAPLEFQEIRDLLPPVSDEKKRLVRQIADLCLADYDEIEERYPLLSARGRPRYRARETEGYPSVETYLIGELSTFSLRTLRMYLDYLRRLRASKRGISRMILENGMRKYGFASLDDAEARLREAEK